MVITHTAETAYALSAHALAFDAGLEPVMITKHGAGFPDAIETVDKETSETYTVSYTTAVLALAMIAHELGAESLWTRRYARPCPGCRRAPRSTIRGSTPIPTPARLLVFAGAGPERSHGAGGRAEGPRGRPLPGRGLRRRVPAARLRRAARPPTTGW